MGVPVDGVVGPLVRVLVVSMVGQGGGDTGGGARRSDGGGVDSEGGKHNGCCFEAKMVVFSW